MEGAETSSNYLLKEWVSFEAVIQNCLAPRRHPGTNLFPCRVSCNKTPAEKIKTGQKRIKMESVCQLSSVLIHFQRLTWRRRPGDRLLTNPLKTQSVIFKIFLAFFFAIIARVSVSGGSNFCLPFWQPSDDPVCVCVCVRAREQSRVGGAGAKTPPPQKQKSLTFQIKTADKWPHDVEEIKGGGWQLNWIHRRLTVYDLNLLGIELHRAGSGSSPRLQPHLGPPPPSSVGYLWKALKLFNPRRG